MVCKVDTAIAILKIAQVIVGKPGLIVLYLSDYESVLIGEKHNRIGIRHLIAVLSECNLDNQIENIIYDKTEDAYRIVWRLY